MQTETNEKIKELAENKEYMEHLLSLGSAEEMSKELAKEGVDLSADDLRKAYELAKKKQEGELSDAELEEVAGGTVLSVLLFVFSMYLVIDGIVTGTSIAKDCRS